MAECDHINAENGNSMIGPWNGRISCSKCQAVFVEASKLDEAGRQFDAALRENRSLLLRLDSIAKWADEEISVMRDSDDPWDAGYGRACEKIKELLVERQEIK